MTVKVLYFASFQEAAAKDSEIFDRPATLPGLYEEIRKKYGFKFQIAHIRVAINGVFVNWQHEINEGDEIAFIPPVSGG